MERMVGLSRSSRWLLKRSRGVIKKQNVRSISSGAASLMSKEKRLASTSSKFHSFAAERIVLEDPKVELERMNEELRAIESDPIKVLEWAMEEFDGRLAMSSSFGIQASVLLHLATRVKPDIPVVCVDTGYLFPETYQYAETLRETLNLNLHIVSNSRMTPARMEAIHGKLWEKDDVESHALYGKLRKVEPLNEGLNSLEPNPYVLLSGLRASQTKARANMSQIGFQNHRFKLLPMLRMTDDDIETYMDRHDLPRHPLQAKRYVTVGDWHSSRPVKEGEDPRNTRFGGKFQECGLHVDDHEEVKPAASNNNKKEEEATTILPESLRKTGVKALGLTKAHPDTGVAVIIVKKLTEDGSYCRKCNDVAEKIEQDNLSHLIGHTSVANVLDHSSEGSLIAKHFGVATAPFFLVRDEETQLKHGEWKVVRSYLQLRKMLEKAADHKIAMAEAGATDTIPEADPVYQETLSSLENLQLEADKMQLDLLEKKKQIEKLHNNLQKRAEEIGVA